MRETVHEKRLVFTLQEVCHNHEVDISVRHICEWLWTGHRDRFVPLKHTMLDWTTVEDPRKVVEERVHNKRPNLRVIPYELF